MSRPPSRDRAVTTRTHSFVELFFRGIERGSRLANRSATPSILRIPSVNAHADDIADAWTDYLAAYSGDLTPLSLTELRRRFSGPIAALPAILSAHATSRDQEDGASSSSSSSSSSSLPAAGEASVDFVGVAYAPGESERAALAVPLAIREGDLDYQRSRVEHFVGLLAQYPASTDRLRASALVDVPPMLRPRLWAALLGVHGDVQGVYDAIDKEAESPVDRQV